LNIADLEKMIATGRDSALLRLTLARLLAREELWERSAEHLQSALTQDPAYTAAWKELGQVLRAQGQNDAAAAAWQKGIEIAQTNGDKQAEKEMGVFLRRLLKSQSAKG